MISETDIFHARILIVDDQSVNVELLEYLLRSTGYRAVSSTTDPHVVAAWHAEHRYDLIILDLQMPGMNGFQVMDALRPLEADSWLPVLVVTAQPDHKVRALEAGARDFLSKPIDPVEVLTRIRNMLEVRLLHREARHYNARLERTVRERTGELQRFRSAMDATADAIFLLDASTAELLDVNDGACRMLAYPRDEILGQTASRLGLGTQAALRAQALRLDDYAAAIGQPRAPELIEGELMRRDLISVPVEIYWQLLRRTGQASVLLGVARDISERRHAEEMLQHMAHYDSLTGLPNRTLFFQTLGDALAVAEEKGCRVVVLLIALDRFKHINDTLGAALGDELLRQFSNRLMQTARLRDTVGRIGGDEFALIMTMPRDQQEAVHMANEVRDTLRQPFDLQGHQAVLSASIGIAMYPDDASDPETLIQYADTAMDRAKQAGRDGYRFFTPGMNVQVLARLDLELALRRAIENDELLLYYQPKVNLRTGAITGAEALLRWQRPGFGLVHPADFVAVMEDTGLIVQVGNWIIDAACQQIGAWLRGSVGPVRVAVNVASRQFSEGDLEQMVRGALARHNVPPELLELELTETALMSSTERTIEVLNKLKALGIKVAIDDFGTGYSSLAYLQRFPIDKLKIDIAFVRDITTNPNDAAIAMAIISMAHSLKLQVIAEGVETRAQLEYLRRSRCDEIQGYFFSRPVAPRDMAVLVESGRCLPVDPDMPVQPAQTLLIVDDNADVLWALSQLFEPDGYQVLKAGSADEAFELLALHDVQVILCDQRLPGMSGTDFLSQVKGLYPQTIRIILSGYLGVDAVLESINRGAIYRFYTKPWDDTQLRDNIRLAFHHYWLLQGSTREPALPAGAGSALAQEVK
ncbi:MAG: EAL domain-containing protein [Duganella sp.]